VGAKEQSGRTWPSIFWARGTIVKRLRSCRAKTAEHLLNSWQHWRRFLASTRYNSTKNKVEWLHRNCL
jgi:hypothetical protein